MYSTSLTFLIIANWTGRGRCLIASVGRVYYRPRSGGWDCTLLAKSDIYDCVVHKEVKLFLGGWIDRYAHD